MIRELKTIALAAVLPVAAAGDSVGLDWEQFEPGLAIDLGQIVKGKDHTEEFKFYPLNRNTVMLSQAAKYGGAWEFTAAFEGIVWWPFNLDAVSPDQRTVRVEPRLYESRAKRNFGSTPGSAYAEFGIFPYKYNRDAMNLGEYLYRSGTYPGTVTNSDGFHLLNHAAYDAYGAHFHLSHLQGFLGQDLNLFVEPAIKPVGDITPAYELALTFPFFQMGVGVAYNRLFSFAPSRTRPKNPDNQYIQVDSTLANLSDTTLYTGPSGAASLAIQNIVAGPANPAYTVTSHYWTQRGVKLMARAALDLGFLLPVGMGGKEGPRLFAEAAVLGWENQLYYYEDRGERIPVMLGFSCPVFTLLDILSFQAEHYSARFNNSQAYNNNGFPRWGAFQPGDIVFPVNSSRDDWKWSLYAKKSVGRLFHIHAQIANDNLRLRLYNSNQTDMPLTSNPTHWYYLVRLEFGG